jgi:hypothetical protein
MTKTMYYLGKTFTIKMNSNDKFYGAIFLTIEIFIY